MPVNMVKLCGQVNTVSWTLTRLTWLGEKGWGKLLKNILGYPFCSESVKRVKVHRSVLKNRREGGGVPHSRTVLKLDWVRCKNCACLKLGSSLPYCTWQGAFLSPDLLGQTWQCEGYKKREVEKP